MKNIIIVMIFCLKTYSENDNSKYTYVLILYNEYIDDIRYVVDDEYTGKYTAEERQKANKIATITIENKLKIKIDSATNTFIDCESTDQIKPEKYQKGMDLNKSLYKFSNFKKCDLESIIDTYNECGISVYSYIVKLNKSTSYNYYVDNSNKISFVSKNYEDSNTYYIISQQSEITSNLCRIKDNIVAFPECIIKASASTMLMAVKTTASITENVKRALGYTANSTGDHLQETYEQEAKEPENETETKEPENETEAKEPENETETKEPENKTETKEPENKTDKDNNNNTTVTNGDIKQGGSQCCYCCGPYSCKKRK